MSGITARLTMETKDLIRLHRRCRTAAGGAGKRDRVAIALRTAPAGSNCRAQPAWLDICWYLLFRLYCICGVRWLRLRSERTGEARGCPNTRRAGLPREGKETGGGDSRFPCEKSISAAEWRRSTGGVTRRGFSWKRACWCGSTGH